MNKLILNLIIYIRGNKILYFLLRPLIEMQKLFKKRNRSLFDIKQSSNKYRNIFIFDTRVHSIIFDSVVYLIRGSNFFYKDKWSLIIYEDDNYRYGPSDITDDIYRNSLINIFLQSLLILPNPPISIKFINDSYELIRLTKKSNKIFPENYHFLSNETPYLIKDFNEKDCENFKINQPILKATKYHSKIFENYLNYRNIKDYITITIRTKDWGHDECNTEIDDIKLYLDFIKKNNLEKSEILILPDTQEDVPKEIINFIENNNLKYHLFHHGSFSIPMRFLAYSKAKFNFASTNGPGTILCFIHNHSYLILNDPAQAEDYIKFVNEYNNKVFLKRKVIFHKKHKAWIKNTAYKKRPRI